MLSSLDLIPKTLEAKRKKGNPSLQQNKIKRQSKASKKLLTFDDANKIESDDSGSSI